MEQITSCRSKKLHLLLSETNYIFFSSLLLIFLLSSQHVEAYKNYTVGDSLGWYDNLKVPKVNYQKWASGKHFSLGDFLIFNTDKNHSVVQTYNVTTYKHCDYNDAQDTDTTEWSVGEPTADNSPVTIAVPLLREGLTYFFSGNYDGEQCDHGQRFKITVTHGEGLPPSLRPSGSTSPAPNAADVVDDVPDTVVPSNFNNPKETGEGDVKATSEAAAGISRRGEGFWLGLTSTLLVGAAFIGGFEIGNV